MERFDWAVNEKKFERACDVLRKQNQPLEEEAIKALYKKFGGLVLGEPETEHGTQPSTLRPVEKIEIAKKKSKK